jgi:hypothetical protein
MSRPAGNGKREVFIEIVAIGVNAKVTAIDSVSGTEVSIVGPASAPRSVLEAQAVKKLEFVLKQKGGG